VTTQDELFQADLFPDGPHSPTAKEVAHYRDALHLGYTRLGETKGLMLNSTLIDMFETLKGRDDGFRQGQNCAYCSEKPAGEPVWPVKSKRDAGQQSPERAK